MNLKKVAILTLCLADVSNTFAQQNVRNIKPVESFIAEQAKITNGASFEGAQMIRRGLKGETFAIPKAWRLVTVVPDARGSSQVREYVLFFQDNKGAVHSLGLDMSGSVSGSNLITIPAQE